MNTGNNVENQSIMGHFKENPAGLVIGLIAILLFIFFSVWWLLSPTYVPLSKAVSETSQSEIITALTHAQIPYQINPKDGLIEVTENNLNAARMQLAQAGIPAHAGLGYELFDHADYGMSEFTQKINYQRALEGELARTIMSMKEVRQARVHLTLKKNTLYQTAKEAAKASVVIKMHPNSSLNSTQVLGIQQLVASAVEGLIQEDVVVLNENGQMLSVSDGVSAVPDRLQLASKIEHDLQNKAEQLLERSFGIDNIYVSVRVQMNFDKMTTIRERPLPMAGAKEGLVIREKESHSNSGSNDNVDDVDETAQNNHSQDNSEKEYAVGKEHSQVEYATGKIENISVGVVLSPSVSNVGVERIQSLLETTLGLNAARGDRISIAYLPLAIMKQNSADATKSAPVLNVDNNIGDKKVSISVIFWLGLSGLIILTMLGLFFWLRTSSKPKVTAIPPLSQLEREQLLKDLRHWLQEPLKEQQ